MRAWNDYKDHVKSIDDANRQEMESIGDCQVKCVN